MQKTTDVWQKPSSLVTNYGRLNRPKNTILYLAHEPANAIYETNCEVNDFFFLLIYQNINQLRLSQIHVTPYFEEFNEVENAKLSILYGFLSSEFTKIVVPGKEYQYRASIAEEFFLDDFIDGFCYPSTRSEHKSGFNICFNEESAKRNVKFIGLMVCKLLPSDGTGEFCYEHYYDGFINEDESFTYYPPNSPMAIKRFGNFAFRRSAGL